MPGLIPLNQNYDLLQGPVENSNSTEITEITDNRLESEFLNFLSALWKICPTNLVIQ